MGQHRVRADRLGLTVVHALQRRLGTALRLLRCDEDAPGQPHQAQPRPEASARGPSEAAVVDGEPGVHRRGGRADRRIAKSEEYPVDVGAAGCGPVEEPQVGLAAVPAVEPRAGPRAGAAPRVTGDPRARNALPAPSCEGIPTRMVLASGQPTTGRSAAGPPSTLLGLALSDEPLTGRSGERAAGRLASALAGVTVSGRPWSRVPARKTGGGRERPVHPRSAADYNGAELLSSTLASLSVMT